MATVIQQVMEAFQSASMKGSRSTALQPLLWLDALLVGLMLAVLAWTEEGWPLVIAAILLVIGVLSTIVAYAFFSRIDPDALRSESYSLRKMELQRSAMGDSVAGLIEGEVVEAKEYKAIASPSEGEGP